jgi:transcription-repair coupling factor (superfamily II helicase)
LNVQQLIKRIEQQKAVADLKELVASNAQSIRIDGLCGSAKSIVASLMLSKGSTFFFVLNEKEEAAYFYNDLYNLTSSDKVLFFPSAYKRSIQYGQEDASGIVQRTAVLNALKEGALSNDFLAIVTYPEALVEKVVSSDKLRSSTLKISVGEKVSIEFVRDVLLEYSFERVDFVSEPGQFAVRGGIVDIFSFSDNKPYRVDFFGDEVESLRTFSIDTQLSEDRLSFIDVVPNLKNAALSDAKESIFSFVPSQTIFWIQELDFLHRRFVEIDGNTDVAKIESANGSGDKGDWIIDQNELIQGVQRFRSILLSSSSLLKQSDVVEFSTLPQPTFNKNFELLSNTILENNQQGYVTCLLSENEAQVERLHNIFDSISKVKIVFDFTSIALHEGFVDHASKVCCYTDHQIFERYQKYKLRGELNKSEAITIQEISNLQIGDYVVHIDHGVGVFGGLVKSEVNGKIQESIKLIYRDNDVLFVNVHALHRISKFKGKDGEPPKIYKLGSGAWQKLKAQAKKKVKDIAKDLIALYSQRRSSKGYRFSPDSFMQYELEASFIYEDTPDQMRTTKAVKEDMEAEMPMDRLVCGDVGFGKTEIAIRAALKAAADSKQVAILVPTTILALQHFKTFKSRLKEFPVKVDFISRLKSAKEIKEVVKEVADGKVDILIGTHRIIGKDLKFKDLGLLIIDEEQKFGVSAKEKLRQLKHNVDTLTLTATPIPRTLQFSLMGVRDLSIIQTPPPNRHPVSTEVHPFNEEIIKEAITYELDRGGQVFFVHNRVMDIVEVENLVKRIVPGVKTLVAHGQMEPDKLEKTMMAFIDGEADILFATSIIESGLDIPNANTIIINNAHHFGLSDLHQLRGRVGRSNKKAFCYLLAPPVASLPQDSRRRLKAIEDFSDLGSGFNIAMQDLDIRGAGNLLGGEQSGFIAEIGFEAYHKILNEAIQELKDSEFRYLFENEGEDAVKPHDVTFVTDCHVDTDMELLLPDSYIGSIPEKIRLYRELDAIEEEQELDQFRARLLDRFGPLPIEVEQLLHVVKLRRLAMSLGFEKIILKNGIMIVYFISNQMSGYYQMPLFGKLIGYIQSQPKNFKVKQTPEKLYISIPNVKDVDVAYSILDGMKKAAQ